MNKEINKFNDSLKQLDLEINEAIGRYLDRNKINLSSMIGVLEWHKVRACSFSLNAAKREKPLTRASYIG